MPIPISVFIGAAAILFVAGIFFIVKGAASEDYEAVPISNFEDIEELKGALVFPKETEPSINEPVARQEETAPEKVQVDQLTEENQRLTEQIRQQKEKSERLARDMTALQEEYSQTQAQEVDAALVDTLKENSVLLEERHKENQNQKVEMEATISRLNTEKGDLSTQLKRREDQAAELNEDLIDLRKTSDEKIQATQAAIDQLRVQKAEDEKAESKISNERFKELVVTIEDLKCENKDLQQLNSDLKDNFKKTEDLNAHLMEKEKTMRYELTKNRAQSLGLEKICEDFKVRIEAKATA